jgi:hypothetical protein
MPQPRFRLHLSLYVHLHLYLHKTIVSKPTTNLAEDEKIASDYTLKVEFGNDEKTYLK